jgi:probable ATP-dependent RNA helicase DDX4
LQLAYLLPIISKLLPLAGAVSDATPQPAALIVAPTRELARQIFNEARKFAHGTAVRVGVLYGGTSGAFQVPPLVPFVFPQPGF